MEECVGDGASSGQSGTIMQIGEYQLLGDEEDVHEVGDDGEESEDE